MEITNLHAILTLKPLFKGQYLKKKAVKQAIILALMAVNIKNGSCICIKGFVGVGCQCK